MVLLNLQLRKLSLGCDSHTSFSPFHVVTVTLYIKLYPQQHLHTRYAYKESV